MTYANCGSVSAWTRRKKRYGYCGFVFRRLSVYFDGTAWACAYNAKDAIAVCEDVIGDEYDEDYAEKFVRQPDGGTFTRVCDYTFAGELVAPDISIPKDAELVEDDDITKKWRATNRSWIRACGRSFLGSTEF